MDFTTNDSNNNWLRGCDLMKSTLYANPLEKVRFSQNWVKFTQTKLSGNLQIEFSTLFRPKF